jgi:hypothetical protein
MDISKKGDPTPEDIWLAVGKALTKWEAINTTIANLFCLAMHSQPWPALRAFGSVTNRQAQRQMILGAAEVNFEKNSDVLDALSKFLKKWDKCGSQRDTIAHRILFSEATFNGEHKFAYTNPRESNVFIFMQGGKEKIVPAQYFLVPPAFAARHRDKFFIKPPAPRFKYNRKRIEEITNSWRSLDATTIDLIDSMGLAILQNASEKS